MAIKGSVTINIAADGTYTLVPPLALVDRNIQTMQWSLNAPANYKFAEPGIVFQPPPSDAYRPWPGDEPTRENDWQYRAKVAKKIAHGSPAEMYLYYIHLAVTVEGSDGSSRVETLRLGKMQHPVTLELIDPDMENQPQP
jgi:hypothetical protein